MKFVAMLLLLCIVAAAMKALAWAFLVLLLWGALTQPGRTFSFLASLAVIRLADTHPIVLLFILAISVVACSNLSSDPEG